MNARQKTRYTALTAQYAEKPKPMTDSSAFDLVPMSAANKKRFDIISEGDEKPFEFVQELKFGDKYPATDETVFDKSWAESYEKKANEVLVPGSAYGHTALQAYKERVKNHTYVTAAKIVGDDTILLRHYVSNKMDANEYASLISEIKAGLISTSIISLYEYKTVTEKDGKVSYHATKSVGRERNDLVEWDQTGMASKMIATSQKAEIDENNGEGDTTMTYAELVAALKSAIEENHTDHLAVAKDLGLNLEILSSEQKAELETLKKIRSAAAGQDVEQIVSDAIAAQGASFITLRDAAMKKAFGHDAELEKSTKELFSLKAGSQKEIDAEVDRIKELSAVKMIAAKSVDGRKPINGGANDDSGDIRIGSSFREGR